MNRLHLSLSLMIISASLVGNNVSRLWGAPIHSGVSVRMAHSAVSDQKTLPPLIDRELFLADPEIIGAQLSPDGNFMAFQKQLNGVMNVWVKGIDEPFSAAYPVTSDTESPIFFYFWSADGRYILYIQDKGGNENFHLYGAELGTALGETPVTRNLTPVDNATVQLYGIPQQTPNEIIIGLNDRDPKFYDVYRLNLTTGERSLIIQNDETIADWTVDQRGTVRLAHRQSLAGGNELLKVENGNFQPIYRCALEETCAPVQFHPNGQQIYLKTNRDTDLTQLELLDLETGQRRLVETDPENQVDFEGALFSNVTHGLIATYYVGDRRRIYAKDETWATDFAFLQQQLPGVTLSLDSVTRDDQLALVGVQSDVNPGAMYLYDRRTQPLEKLYDAWPELPNEYLATVDPIRYLARDGVEIPAYLTLPQGITPENLPVIVFPHGGPWGRDTWGYSPLGQFFANRGYAVLQPNFRGSAGYGKAFLNAGNQAWGKGVMQHDVTDGVQYLIDQGIADPERIGITGFSYGGYATLAGLAFTPELYAAGAALSGPSNLITLMQEIPPYWVPIRDSLSLRVGNPDDPRDRNRLMAQSPLFAADQIQAPLLVVQGANDPRVPKAESDQIVAALRERNRPVEYLVALDEGHGFRQEDNIFAMTAALERFFANHLGGRYQAELSPELQAQLEILTVDIGTVQ
ncbi:dipeptidyl aminopeptidase/acylaminoacyl peptidase [Leptolyngbya sp. PCC 7375]|nr:dipeptidyl aminopeptidase/acylaminoacyl peptidase [Leptolyngbya sp. PCC 7375]